MLPSPAAGARLGVVDDDPSVLRALVACLQGAGYQVDGYGSAEEFLRRRPADPHVVLVLDVDMPGQSGLDLQAMLGGDPAGRRRRNSSAEP